MHIDIKVQDLDIDDRYIFQNVNQHNAELEVNVLQ